MRKEVELGAGYKIIAEEKNTEFMGSFDKSIDIKVYRDNKEVSCTEMDETMCRDKSTKENLEYLCCSYLDYIIGLTESEQKKVCRALRRMVAAISM